MNAFRQEIIMNKYQAVIIGFGKAGKTGDAANLLI